MFAVKVFSVVLLLPITAGGLLADPSEKEEERSRSPYLIETSVMGSAGAPGASAQFRSNGTLGQPTPIGTGSSDGFGLYAGFWCRMLVATDVLEGIIPEVFKNTLFPNAPNPFNPLTTIRYEVGESAPVEIRIYSIQGRLVRSFAEGVRSPGRHEVLWDGRDDRGMSVGSGVYLYALRIGSYGAVKKMLLLR